MTNYLEHNLTDFSKSHSTKKKSNYRFEQKKTDVILIFILFDKNWNILFYLFKYIIWLKSTKLFFLESFLRNFIE